MRVLGPNDKLISGLTAAGALAGTDLLPVVQSAATRKATVDQIASYVSRALYNASTTTPGAGFAADTYLAGSDILIPAPATQLQSKTTYELIFSVAKTGAGTAAPVLTLRFGIAGSISDASVCAFTFPAQTAVVDEGLFTVNAHFRSVGSGTAAVIVGVAQLVHDNGSAGSSAGTGLSVQSAPIVITVGGGFNSTVANSRLGLSVNGGTSAAWTIALVEAKLVNLA